MLCDNCGKRNANVKYSENINGKKKELNLCEECSQKLGIGNIDFNMPIDFTSFFKGFMEDFTKTSEYIPLMSELNLLKCNSCGYTFDDIVNNGMLGCAECYEVFEDKLEPIIKRMQGANRHVGRIGKIIDRNIENKNKANNNKLNSNNEKREEEKTEIQKLQEELDKAIKEEKYEKAAEIRDKIKEIRDVS